MSHVWETSFPTVECQTIATAILQRSLSPQLARDAWIVGEYGLGQILPGDLKASLPPGDEVDLDTAARQLLDMCGSHLGSSPELAQGALALPAMSWVAILRAVLQIIANVLPSA